MGTGIFPGVGGRSGLEADHSPPSSAKAKNEWSYKSIPHTLSCGRALLLRRSHDDAAALDLSLLDNVLLVAPQPATISKRFAGPMAQSVMCG